MNPVSNYCPHCGNLKREEPKLEAGVFYTYMIYLKYSMFNNLNNNTSSISNNWDTAISVVAKTPEQAILNLPEQFKDWVIVKIDGPNIINLNSNQTPTTAGVNFNN
jgi:hypothetical protein